MKLKKWRTLDHIKTDRALEAYVQERIRMEAPAMAGLMGRAVESLRSDLECSCVSVGDGWYDFTRSSDFETVAYSLRDVLLFGDALPFTVEFSEEGDAFRLVDK